MRFSLLTLATAVLLLAPQVVLAQNSLTASPAVSVGTDQEPDQSHPAGGDVVITQSVSSTVDGGGVSCGNSGAGYTTENSYWRLFDLAAMGFNDDITLTSVDMGVRVALNGNPSLSTSLRFYTLEGEFLIENLTLIDEVEWSAQEGEPQAYLLNLPISDTIVVPGGSMFVVEWFTPSGDPAETGYENPIDIRYGRNTEGETGPTYLSSESCAITEPTPTSEIGEFGHLHWVLFVNGTMPVANEAGSELPTTVTLGASYPNPFNPTATVPFTVNEASDVRVSVFDALGREVAVLASGLHTPGAYSVTFDAAGLPSGTYLYRLEANGEVQMRTMTLLK